MKEIDWIINEQAALLKDKGYDDVSLHTADAEINYKTQLKDNLRDILDNPDLQFSQSYFNIHLFGQFGKDAVAFTLTYSFDPLDKTLTATAVAASMNESKIVEKVEKAVELWTAQELYFRVKQMSLVIGPHYEQERQKALQAVLQQQASLLAQKGYGVQEKIYTRLNIELGGILDAKSPERSFILKCKVKESNFINPLNARFHFHFNPAAPTLHLKSVHFSMSRITELLLKPKNHEIPIPRVICSRLADAATTKKVNQILAQLNRQQPDANHQKKGKQ